MRLDFQQSASVFWPPKRALFSFDTVFLSPWEGHVQCVFVPEARAPRQVACILSRLYTQANDTDNPITSQPESFPSGPRFSSPTSKQPPTLSRRPRSPTNRILCHQEWMDNRLCVDTLPTSHSTTQACPQCSGRLQRWWNYKGFVCHDAYCITQHRAGQVKVHSDINLQATNTLRMKKARWARGKRFKGNHLEIYKKGCHG